MSVLLFLRSNWQLIAIALLAIAVRFEHGRVVDIQKNFDLHLAADKLAIAERKAEDAKHRADDLEFHQQQDTRHAQQVNALTTSLGSVVGELQLAQQKLVAGAASAKPIRVASNICNNAERDGRLSDAVSKAESGIRDVARDTEIAIRRYQVGVGQSIVHPAGVQQIERNEIIDWARRGNKVNAQPPPK